MNRPAKLVSIAVIAALIFSASASAILADPINIRVTPTAPAAAPPASASSSRANPSTAASLNSTITDLNQRNALAAEANARIDQLNQELEVTVEDFNLASEKLKEAEKKLDDINQQLALAQSDYDEQKNVLSERVTNLYKDRYPANLIALLLDTKTLGDLFMRIGFLTRISKSDSSLVDEIDKKKTTIADLSKELGKERQSRLAIQKEIQERRSLVETKLADQQKYLDGLSSGVKEILKTQVGREARRQAELVALITEQFQSWNLPQVQHDVISAAFRHLGVPYVWGGSTPSGGFDCSGLVMYVFAQFGVALPHHAATQYQLEEGMPVDVSQLQPGDLVYFGVSRIHHVAMYIGGGYVIHAPNRHTYVKISPLSDFHDYAGARRFNLFSTN